MIIEPNGINLFEFIGRFWENLQKMSSAIWDIMTYNVRIETIIRVLFPAYNLMELVFGKQDKFIELMDTWGNVSIFELFFGGGLALIILIKVISFVTDMVS